MYVAGESFPRWQVEIKHESIKSYTHFFSDLGTCSQVEKQSNHATKTQQKLTFVDLEEAENVFAQTTSRVLCYSICGCIHKLLKTLLTFLYLYYLKHKVGREMIEGERWKQCDIQKQTNKNRIIKQRKTKTK